MGLGKFITKVCTQTAVYWGTPVSDGSGGFTYADAVEISCRWDDIQELIIDNKGREIMSVAKLIVTQDLDQQGWLYLGTLDDLDSAPQPLSSSGAYPIARITKIPELKSTTKFIRRIYLGSK